MGYGRGAANVSNIISGADNQNVTFDISSDSITLPTASYTKFIAAVTNMTNVAIKGTSLQPIVCKDYCYFQDLCSVYMSVLNDFTVTFGDQWSYTIPWANMVVDSFDNNNFSCRLKLDKGAKLVFGQPFLKSYYAMFDWQLEQVAIAKGISSTANVTRTF
jgi:hypothetical protein